jgi:hypothetical protein
MAVGLAATTLANKWLDMISGTAFTAPAGSFAKLHTADPGSAGATAAAVGSATRVTIPWAAASAGSKAMSGTNPSWTNGGTSETITHVSVWDASSAGNFLYSFALTASKAWASGDTLTLTSHSFALTPIAA